MPAKFIAAPEVEQIARELIRAHHPHLRLARMEFLFSPKGTKSKGREVWGTMRKVSSLSAFLAGETDEEGPGALFCMVISEPIWNVLTAARRRALVDHELAHAWIEAKDDGSLALQIVGHDVEEFASVILRHGLYRDDLVQLSDCMAQAAQRSLYEGDDGQDAADNRQARIA